MKLGLFGGSSKVHFENDIAEIALTKSALYSTYWQADILQKEKLLVLHLNNTLIHFLIQTRFECKLSGGSLGEAVDCRILERYIFNAIMAFTLSNVEYADLQVA